MLLMAWSYFPSYCLTLLRGPFVGQARIILAVQQTLSLYVDSDSSVFDPL